MHKWLTTSMYTITTSVVKKNLQDIWNKAAQQMADSTLYDASTNNTLPQITQCSLPLKHTG